MKHTARALGWPPTFCALTWVALVAVSSGIAWAKPVVAITSPTEGGVVAGETWVNVAFRSDSRRPIVRLELQLDGRDLQSYVVPSPLLEGQKSFPVDMGTVPPGPHTLTVRALDSVGEAGQGQIGLTVSTGGALPVGETDRIPPAISVYYPAQGATVAGRVTVRAEATDNVSVRNVVFYVDGKLHTMRMNAPPFTADWDTSAYTEGPHILEARAKDTADNEGTAAPVTVIVQNKGLAPAPAAPGGFATPGPAINPTAPTVWSPTAMVPGVAPGGPGTITSAPPGPIVSAPPTGPVALPGPGGLIAPSVVAPELALEATRTTQPQIAVGPTTAGAVPRPVTPPEARLLAPPALAPEAAIPREDASPARVPGTDLSAARPEEPELAAPVAKLESVSTDAGVLPVESPQPELAAPEAGAVVRPALGAVVAPELASEADSGPVPVDGGGGIETEDAARPQLETPSEGTAVRPALEKLPEPELAAPEPALTASEQPMAPPTALEGAIGPSGPVEPAAVAVAVPETTLPETPAPEPPATPPETATGEATTETPVSSPGSLIAQPVELYQEGPVTVVPGSTMRENPKPVATPSIAPAPAPVPTEAAASAPDALAAALGGAKASPETNNPGAEPGATLPPKDSPAVAVASGKPRSGLRRARGGDVASGVPAATPAPATGLRAPTAADGPGLSEAKVLFHGSPMPDDARPEVREGILLVSLRHVASAVDPGLYWAEDETAARAFAAGMDIAVQIGAERATVNGETWELTGAVVRGSGRVLVPIELAEKALKVSFQYDPATREVHITR